MAVNHMGNPFKIRLVRLVAGVCLLIAMAPAFFSALPVRADSTGLDDTAGTAFKGNIPFKDKDESFIIGSIVGSLLSFIGIVFFVLIVYGGFLWMTARGNETQVGTAKNLIVSAVIGLIIIFSAYAITKYIGGMLGQ